MILYSLLPLFAILNFAVDPDREHSEIKFRAKFNESTVPQLVEARALK